MHGSDPDLLRVKTDDGANLALRHYRPDPDAPFNDGKQPILMMPPAACNFNIYDIHTPKGQEPWSSLPGDLPGWAKSDERVRKDPMLLYSTAYYLYSTGYDVWMYNYRGQGRGKYRSLGPVGADIDHYAIYDLKAMVMKVRELTGKRPVHLGHSMGGTTALIYFQGACHISGSNSRVESDPRLVEERNAGDGPQAVKGFVNLDGPRVPFVFGNTRLPLITWATWVVTALPIYYNLRLITRWLPRKTGKYAMAAFSAVWKIRGNIPKPIDNLIAIAFSGNPDNLDPDVLGYVCKYAADGGTAHAAAQYLDACQCGKLRESYRGGNWGKRKMYPRPDESDGLYYYSDHMDRISVPSLFLADGTVDITTPEEIRKCFDLKTRHPLDEYYVMENTAHVDIPCGLRAPFETYPKIGAWLEKLGSD